MLPRLSAGMLAIMLRRAIGCVILLTVALAGRAEAEPVIGGTCVPDSATIRLGLHETAGFGVRFSGTHTGQIRLLCPFDADASGLRLGGMQMSFIDSDGMNVGGRVRAHLRRAAYGTNIAVTLGTCDSNTSNTTGPQKMDCFLPSVFMISAGDLYWWEIIIERSSPAVNVEFLGVRSFYSP